VRRLQTSSLPARAAAITFDDGYADNCTHALPILQRHGAHATFFIATGFLNGGRMWNDTIIESIRHTRHEAIDLTSFGLGVHKLSSIADRRAALSAIIPVVKYQHDGERKVTSAAIADICSASLPDDLMMSDDNVRTLAKSGMGIGAHTHHHPILAGIPDERAWDEIIESRTRLSELSGREIRLFAYPNGVPGRDFTSRHVVMLRESGFDAAVTTGPGAASRFADPLQLPRFTPWDRSCSRFAARLMINYRK
jgi:peptidoglycan/xylan/chitin deacetylase (PgdA/CDA1 family)